jgi:poly(A) polymerase Pap1
VLVARVCQMFPNATVSMLVSRFFWIYAHWQWPTPVTLVETQPDYSDGSERHHHMPIIIPVYPYSCCSYNVTRSTLQKLKSEFSRGWDAIMKMELNWSTCQIVVTGMYSLNGFLSALVMIFSFKSMLQLQMKMIFRVGEGGLNHVSVIFS